MLHRVKTRRIYKTGKISVERRLSTSGEILVQIGQKVSAHDTIGQITLPGAFVVINVAQALGLQTADISAYLCKAEGDLLSEGDILAEAKRRIPFLTKVCKSPVKGRLAIIAGRWLLIETESNVEAIQAFVAGRIADVYQSHRIIIETRGTYVEAACGLGGEAYGILQSPSPDPTTPVTIEAITLADQPTILLVGGAISEETVWQAKEIGVKGLIVGSIDASLLEIDPPPQMPIVATEGFGNRPMAVETWTILQDRLGDLTSIRGSMSTTTTSEQSVIIIPQAPLDDSEQDINGMVEVLTASYITVGCQVRGLREPTLMTWGRVSAIKEGLQATPAETVYWGADVDFAQDTQFVPWFNLEQIEQIG